MRPGEESLTEELFASLHEVIVDGEIARRAGAYLARYARGHGLTMADALIAASATIVGLQLWTRNRRHFPMPDLRFYEPDR